jgi:hypothetical protein
MNKDYCIKCKLPMVEIPIGGTLDKCFTCTNKECDRFGLLAVIGYKLVKKIEKEKEVKKDGKIRTKDSKKQYRPQN